MIKIDCQNLCLGCMEEKGGGKTCPHCGYDQTSGPASSHHLALGTILHDKYLIGKVLGQGGFGITYLAWDSILDLKLAIKEFFPMGLVARSAGNAHVETYAGDQGEQFSFGLDRFLGEAKTLARFSEHPNIVTVRDFFKANNTAYMVMNYIEGLTLEAYLKQSGGIISFAKTLEIMMPVLDALREVHRAGFMHRDISPDNIFINQDGRVVLIDFGAARQEMREKSKSLSVILKAGYAPEEQYRSRGKQGPWTDIYAVAATMYRCITGEVPSEAIDRLDEDDLTPPSQLGVTIEQRQEEVLLKALAVKAKARYQAVDEFQSELVASPAKNQIREGYTSIKLKDSPVPVKAEIKSSETIMGRKSKTDVKQEVVRAVKTAALVTACGLLIFGAFSLFGGGEEAPGQAGPAPEEQQPTYDPAVIAGLDSDYYIDYENGTIPLGDLPIGAQVVDPSWEWEFRTDYGYTGSGIRKPVTWIIVARDHYSGLEPHVTLLAEELIGKLTFDNSTNRGNTSGSNHWGDSGTANATHGLRPWLNSTGIHSGEGFYRAFSENFKGAVLVTTLPNRAWLNGSTYSTQDRVFLPSTTELGDSAHDRTYQIGSAYSYFSGEGSTKRVARLGGETWKYWTRSPSLEKGLVSWVRGVAFNGEFIQDGTTHGSEAVRPAVNLKSEILVSEIRN